MGTCFLRVQTSWWLHGRFLGWSATVQRTTATGVFHNGCLGKTYIMGNVMGIYLDTVHRTNNMIWRCLKQRLFPLVSGSWITCDVDVLGMVQNRAPLESGNWVSSLVTSQPKYQNYHWYPLLGNQMAVKILAEMGWFIFAMGREIGLSPPDMWIHWLHTCVQSCISV
jgi:hypothetical protein